MVILEALFLVFFWGWVFTAALFLRNTRLPRMPLSTSPAVWQLPFVSVRFQATDGIWLSGWKIATDPQEPWIILCHGLGTNRADLLDLAAALHHARYNLFLFDFRAHGESQGATTSFGWNEQRDLEGALAFLGTQPEVPERPYGVFGISMGGAVAIMVAARDERVGAVAVEGVYEDLQESIGHHLKLLYRLPRVPCAFFASSAYRLRVGVWPRHMSPIKEVSALSPRPLFIIHGAQDARMPLANANALFETAREPKDLCVIPDAGHLGGHQANPADYERRLVRFFDSHLRK